MKNEGTVDRAIRVVLGLVLLALAWIALGASPFGIVVGIVGLVLLVTGFVGFCPAYRLIGVRTCSVSPRSS